MSELLFLLDIRNLKFLNIETSILNINPCNALTVYKLALTIFEDIE